MGYVLTKFSFQHLRPLQRPGRRYWWRWKSVGRQILTKVESENSDPYHRAVTAAEVEIMDSIIMAEAALMEMAVIVEMGDSIMAAERISTIMEVIVMGKFKKIVERVKIKKNKIYN